jgi:hypothetical protein
MHISWLQAGTREYDLEYLQRLEEFLQANRMNDKWAEVQRHYKNSRYIMKDEKIRINAEIARIKNKWHL